LRAQGYEGYPSNFETVVAPLQPTQHRQFYLQDKSFNYRNNVSMAIIELDYNLVAKKLQRKIHVAQLQQQQQLLTVVTVKCSLSKSLGPHNDFVFSRQTVNRVENNRYWSKGRT
jgi:hypothetical protein